MMTAPRLLSLLLATGLGVACSSGNSASTGQAGSSSSTAAAPAAGGDRSAEAKQIFSTRCTPCHGAEGRGDGPASASLTPRPRNFHDTAWQQQASDDHIARIIQYGGAAVGKSPAMPPNPDLNDKPELVAALRKHIRALSQ